MINTDDTPINYKKTKTTEVTKQSSNDLLCCPCCGYSPVKIIKGGVKSRKTWTIFCPRCQIRTGSEHKLWKAKEVWNNRTTSRTL